MADTYLKYSQTPLTKKLLSFFGLPIPPQLTRPKENPELIVNRILLGGDSSSAMYTYLTEVLNDNIVSEKQSNDVGGLVFNATHITQANELSAIYTFFHQHLRSVQRSGKIVVIGVDPKHCENSQQATAQRGLVGFVKSLAKEVGRKGITVNLLYTHSGADQEFSSSLRFLLSYRSAYVNGQVITEQSHHLSMEQTINWQQPLAGKVALVTGASRGIGAEIVKVLARDGAKVIGLDIPQAKTQLDHVMQAVNGEMILANITEPNVSEHIATAIDDIAGAVDIVIHNAGITRDKMLVNMPESQWEQVLAVNLTSIENINTHLLKHQRINAFGRIVCVSSISGIAGNVGQTNYATSKASIIGLIESMPAQLSDKNITINAVAPGFIETDMTATIPVFTRFVGRRMSALSQGGLPVDVAETISYLASPYSQGVSGNLIRVCGLNMMGS